MILGDGESHDPNSKEEAWAGDEELGEFLELGFWLKKERIFGEASLVEVKEEKKSDLQMRMYL